MTKNAPYQTCTKIRKDHMTHITFLAYPDCAVSCITGCIDAFAIANRWNTFTGRPRDNGAPLFTWDVVSLDGTPVQGGSGFMVQPDASIHDVEQTDLILLPGFLPPLNFIGMVPEALAAWLKKHNKKGAMIGTICTGAFMLAETGLLDGRIATTNWAFAEYFRKLYPSVNLKPERIIAEDGNFISSGATTSFLDLCIYLIEKFGNGELARYCSKSLLVEPGREMQSPFFIFHFQKDHGDETVLKAQLHMEDNFSQAISIEALASELGISPRHFIRRFKTATGDSPLLYLQRLRIEAAKQKLEETMKTVDEITRQVGYENTNSFRKLFKNNTGLSPREYRNRFSKTREAAPAN